LYNILNANGDRSVYKGKRRWIAKYLSVTALSSLIKKYWLRIRANIQIYGTLNSSKCQEKFSEINEKFVIFTLWAEYHCMNAKKFPFNSI